MKKLPSWTPWLLTAISVAAGIIFNVVDRAASSGRLAGEVAQMNKRLEEQCARFESFDDDLKWLRDQFLLMGKDYQRSKRRERRREARDED